MKAFALIIAVLIVNFRVIASAAIENESATSTCTCVPLDDCDNFVKSDIIKTTCQSFLDVCCEAEHLVAHDEAIRFDGATSRSSISAKAIKPLSERSAKSADGEDQCTCVPYYQCKESGRINPDAVKLIDVRKPTCKNYLDICCESGDLITEGIPPLESSTTAKATTTTNGNATTDEKVVFVK